MGYCCGEGATHAGHQRAQLQLRGLDTLPARPCQIHPITRE